MKQILIIISVIILFSCANSDSKDENANRRKKDSLPADIASLRDSNNGQLQNIEKPELEDAKVIYPEIIRKFEHDKNAYTQGLLFRNGYLIESTGQYGQSSIRKVDINSGKVLKKVDIPYNYFGEGITIHDEKLYMLTWRERTCFIFDPDTFEEIETKRYYSEGWGLEKIGDRLIMSDGSNFLRYLDPDSFEILKTISIYEGNFPVQKLNELEYIEGMLFANIWMEDKIAVIDPDAAEVLAYVDCSELREFVKHDSNAETLNGIAYINGKGTFILTGKNWPFYFEVSIDINDI